MLAWQTRQLVHGSSSEAAGNGSHMESSSHPDFSRFQFNKVARRHSGYPNRCSRELRGRRGRSSSARSTSPSSHPGSGSPKSQFRGIHPSFNFSNRCAMSYVDGAGMTDAGYLSDQSLREDVINEWLGLHEHLAAIRTYWNLFLSTSGGGYSSAIRYVK